MLHSLSDKKTSGFTLIELIIVITIIAILVTIAYGQFSKYAERSRDTKRKTDLKNISQSLETYEQDKECYPSTLPACGNSFPAYMREIPCDPGGQSYYYWPQQSVCPKWYQLFAKLKFESDPVIAEKGCTNGCGPDNSNTVFNYYVTSANAPQPYQVP